MISLNNLKIHIIAIWSKMILKYINTNSLKSSSLYFFMFKLFLVITDAQL